ncbi:MAG: hypothetical protein R3F24_11035 [Gammaproteobacteria bacterium]
MPTLIEKHLAYVDNATVTAQKRQQKLWKAVTAKRTRGGLLPLTDEVLDEYIQAARMTASLMIDIEMVRDEYLAEKSGARAGKGRKSTRKKAARKKP